MIEWKWDDNGRMARERDPSPAARELPLQGSQEGRKKVGDPFPAARELPLQGSQEGRKKVGDQVQFTPAANFDHSCGFPEILRDRLVTGTVVQIHEEHRWYRVRYELPGGVIAWECFKF